MDNWGVKNLPDFRRLRCGCVSLAVPNASLLLAGELFSEFKLGFKHVLIGIEGASSAQAMSVSGTQ